MDEGNVIAVLLIGVLFYKTLELVVIRDKAIQAFMRGHRSPAAACAGSTLWANVVRFLNEEFYLVILAYSLAAVTLLGLFLIVAQARGTHAYPDAKIIAAFTIMASIFLACLNIAVERYRTAIERS